MSAPSPFRPALYSFLRDLEANNEREWFKSNKDRYESQLRDPALEFIDQMVGPLKQISPHFTADTRTVGGSLFRIYRDTRFAADKTPYKTHVGIHFRHENAKDAHAPGFYLHLERGSSMAAAGLWAPETAVANQIRQQIADDPAGWKKAAHGKRFTDVWTVDGEKLKRPPKGFDPDHPYIEDMKLKSFTCVAKLSQKQTTSDGFVEEFARIAKAASPFVSYLCGAVGQPF